MDNRNPIIAWRERHGLTQTAAAAALGCGRRSLQAWENERAGQIPLYILLACAAVALKIRPVK
jgi:DNA-binding XRE family transcriptional regulator